MMRDWILPGLLETGPVDAPGGRIMAIRDGLVNLYVVRGGGGLVCVDAGWRPHAVRHGFETLGLDIGDVIAVLLTHMHWDHARCRGLYPNARVFAGGGEEPARPDGPPPRDGRLLPVAGLEARAIATPGHTPDSVCYLLEGRFLFTGDALRLRRGRVAVFPTQARQDREAVRRSIRKLAGLRGVECLLTAHTGFTLDVAAAFQGWREEDEHAG